MTAAQAVFVFAVPASGVRWHHLGKTRGRVTDQCNHAMIAEMGMKAAATVRDAVAMAQEAVGDTASITVIPNGISVIVTE